MINAVIGIAIVLLLAAVVMPITWYILEKMEPKEQKKKPVAQPQRPWTHVCPPGSTLEYRGDTYTKTAGRLGLWRSSDNGSCIDDAFVAKACEDDGLIRTV